MGTAQPTIARLERGDYQAYSMATLAKVARTLGSRLRVELEPAGVAGPAVERPAPSEGQTKMISTSYRPPGLRLPLLTPLPG